MGRVEIEGGLGGVLAAVASQSWTVARGLTPRMVVAVLGDPGRVIDGELVSYACR